MTGATAARVNLLGPKWVFGHVLALVLVLLFVNNGFWQLGRLEQRREHNSQVAAMSALPLAPLADALAPLDRGGAIQEFRAVEASGVYLTDSEVLLRGRSHTGRPGFHVLTPLALDESAGDWQGRLLLVDRGWVAFENDSVPVAIASPAAASVTIEGRLRAPTSPPSDFTAALAPRDPSEGRLVQSYYVDIERLAPQMPGELVPAYVELTAQLPVQPGEYPLIVPPPEATEGSHLGYAIQWFSFAVVGVVGYALLLRSVTRSGRAPSARPRGPRAAA